MSLIGRIEAALDAGVDPLVFERCAIALMSNHYDNVVGVEGGSDGGRDGDIYAPLVGEPDSRGRILVTVGDVLDNLKRSHATWEKYWAAGDELRVDQLVLVTPNSLSETKRRNIVTYCRNHSLPVPQFWTRQWLVNSLRKDEAWRVELTGVRGRLESLTTIPVHAAAAVDLVGRIEEVRLLTDALAGPGDVCLLGLPGVGKTRLLAELAGRVHYVDPLAQQHLVDDLFAIDPSIVVLDDAHLHGTTLEELSRIRAVERLSFKIVAASWPGREADLRPLLNDPQTVNIDRLERASMDSMVQQLGVTGVHARATILHHADGRPGWATVLCGLVADDQSDGSTASEFLLGEVAGLARSIAGTAALNDALACIAALGAASADDLDTIAQIAAVSPADLVEWLEATAQGGLLEQSNDHWSVLAPVRPLIVAASFFGRRKIRRWSSLVSHFDGDNRLVRTLLQVVDLISEREGRLLADAWFEEIVDRPIDAETCALVELYAQIDEQSGDRAAALARRVLDSPRETVVSAWGGAYDPVGEAARRILAAAFRSSCGQEAAEGLFDLAVDDHRPRHSHPDHPMRVIQELVQHLDPDYGPFSELRPRVLKFVVEWFDSDPTADRWRILAEAARYVFDPQVEGNWPDPGNNLSFTLARGIAPSSSLNELLAGWEAIDSRACGPSGATIPAAAIGDLCGLFQTWSGLAAGHSAAGGVATPDHVTSARQGATMIHSTLCSLAPRFPAVAIRVNQQLDLLELWNSGQVLFDRLPITDDRVARFVGARDLLDDDIDAWSEQRRQEQESLAAEVGALGAEDGIAEFERLIREAEVLEGAHTGDPFANLLTAHVDEPVAWLTIAISRPVPPLVAPMLRLARTRREDVTSLATRALNDPQLRHLVIRAVLTERGDVDDLSRHVIGDLNTEDVESLAELWMLDEATPVLRDLLTHPVPDVRAHAAIAFGEGLSHGPDLPEALRPAWRAGVVAADPNQFVGHSRWRLEKVLDHAVTTDPVVCADWFVANAGTGKPGRLLRTPAKFSSVVRSLPRDIKRQICTRLDSETLMASGYIDALLGSDEELVADLWESAEIDVATLKSAMTGARDITVETIGATLLRAGVPADVIARRALSSRSWTGQESASIRADIDFFTDLKSRRDDFNEVCAVALTLLHTELADVEAQEKQDRIRGW